VAKPGVGKSWVALEGCVAAVQEGGTAVYLDMEDNGSAELEDRAMMLGMDPRHIMQGKFRVISPEDFMEPGEPGDAGKIVRNILAGWIKNPPSVVVVDSMAKVLRSLDLDPNSEPDVVSLISMFTPLRKTEKCCIIFVDHVGHAAIGRPSGSQHKIGQVDFTFLLARKDNDAEKYPTTAMAMDVTRVKDRFTGSNVLEDPANPNYLGVISIDNVVDRSGNLQRVNIPGVALNDPDYAEVTQMDFRLIPGKKIGEKQRRDEAEEKVQKAENATAEAEQALRGILQGGEAAATPLKASLKDCGVAQEYQRSIMAAAEAGELPGVVVRQAGRSKYYSLA
jgi:KaiC/GvpD/RAD55 family RecA-like ATPase